MIKPSNFVCAVSKGNNPLFLMPSFMILMYLSSTIFGAMKAVNPQCFVVGQSFAGTFFPSTFSYMFINATILHSLFKGYSRTLPREGQDRLKKVMITVTIISRPIYFFNLVGSVMPLFILSFPDVEFIFGSVFFVDMAVILLICRVVIINAPEKMIDELNKHIEPQLTGSAPPSKSLVQMQNI